MHKIPAGLIAAAALVSGDMAIAQERVIDADNPVIEFTVDGETAALEVTPDGAGSPVFSAALAKRLGLKGSMLVGVHMVGVTKVTAESNLVRIDLGDGKAKKRRAFFFDTDEWHHRGEGSLGPSALPDDVITFRLRAPQEGEREITLPLVEHKRAGFYTRFQVGEKYIPTFISFARPETMANASAGAILAQAFGARMEGESREMHIELGIHRPVRDLVVPEGLMLGELPVKDIVVRSQDTGSTAAIPDEESDPNEIVVTGGKMEIAPRLWIGTASLEKCSTLRFDRPAEVIRLSCKFD